MEFLSSIFRQLSEIRIYPQNEYTIISHTPRYYPNSVVGVWLSGQTHCRYECALPVCLYGESAAFELSAEPFSTKLPLGVALKCPGPLRTKGNKTCQTVKWSCPFKPCQTRSRSDKIAGSISACPFRLAATAPKDVERRSALRTLKTVNGTKALRCEKLQCYHCFNPGSAAAQSKWNRPSCQRDSVAQH